MKRIVIPIFLLLAGLTQTGADIAGTWTAAVTLDAGSGTATFNFQQKGDVLSGTYEGVLGQAKVSGTVKGDQVEWSFSNDQAGQVVYKGTLDGATKIKGTVVYGQLGSGTFIAEKK